MAKELKKVLVSSEIMTKLAKRYHEKEKTKASYEDIEKIVKSLIDEDESVILATKNNAIQATAKISYLFDKNDMSEKDRKRYDELEKEMKELKAKYPNTKKSVSITNIK